MDTTTIEGFLTSYSPEVRELVLRARALVLDAVPGVVELVDPPSKIIAYGFGQKYSELICAIAPYKSYANLIFSRGVDLPDPDGLLSGKGKRARHVKLGSLADIERPGVRALLEAAVQKMR